MSGQNRTNIDRLLAENFKELACQRPIEKITIKEITDRAGVIRPTFYNHFQDKYELLEWIIMEEVLTPIKPDLGRIGRRSAAADFYRHPAGSGIL